MAGRSAEPDVATNFYPILEGLRRWRLADNHRMDRSAQHNNTIYSGIDGIHLQDQAITESMGPIVDHAFEHLAPSDQMITHTRRRLLMAARALRDEGLHRHVVPGIINRVAAERKNGDLVSDDKTSWQDLYVRQLAASLRPA